MAEVSLPKTMSPVPGPLVHPGLVHSAGKFHPIPRFLEQLPRPRRDRSQRISSLPGTPVNMEWTRLTAPALSDAQVFQILDRGPHLACVPGRPVVALR